MGHEREQQYPGSLISLESPNNSKPGLTDTPQSVEIYIVLALGDMRNTRCADANSLSISWFAVGGGWFPMNTGDSVGGRIGE